MSLETDIHLSHYFDRLPVQQSRIVRPLDHRVASCFYQQRVTTHQLSVSDMTHLIDDH